MPDRMDVDTNTDLLRDPRLSRPARPPLSNNEGRQKTQVSSKLPNAPKPVAHPPPNVLKSRGQLPPDVPMPSVNKQNENSGASFIQAISGLVQAAVATAMSKAEKERLEKRRETTEGHLRKAKAHTNFPASAAFFQQASKDENDNLSRMDDIVKEQLLNCSQIEERLISKWGALTGSNSQTEEAIRKLQDDLQATKNEASAAKAEVARLVEGGPIKLLQDNITILQETLGNHSSKLNEQGKTLKSGGEQLAALCEEVKKKPIALSEQPKGISTQIRAEINDLRYKIGSLDSGLKRIADIQGNVSQSIGQVTVDFEGHRRRMDEAGVGNIKPTRKKVDDLYSYLNSLENKVETKSATPTPAVNGNNDLKNVSDGMERRLNSLDVKSAASKNSNESVNPKIQALNDRIEELSKLQEMKDELQFAEMEEIKKTLYQNNSDLAGLKSGLGQVAAEIRNVAQMNPAAALQQVQGLSGSLQSTQRLVETLQVSLHSLEVRYNHISTEPIVKNMVVAMQELYPSASQLTEHVTALRNQHEKELVPLRSRVEHLIKSHSTHVAQMQLESDQRLEEINRIKADNDRIEQLITGILDRVDTQGNAQGSWPGISQVQPRVEGLSRRLDEHVANVGKQLRSNKTSHDTLVNSMNGDRENLTKELEKLSTEVKALTRQLSEVGSSNQSNIEATTSQWNDIGSLLDRMHQVEDSALRNHEKLFEQFGMIKKAVETQEGLLDGAKNKTESPQQRVEGDEEQKEQEESPVNGHSTTKEEAEDRLALALREKKKKKRPRPSNVSDDERPLENRRGSPRLSTPADGTPGDAKKKMKKKKRKLHPAETITLDD